MAQKEDGRVNVRASGAGVQARRLTPGLDIKSEIAGLVHESGMRAGVILSMVGSLEKACLRPAGQEAISQFDGPLEIVSCQGTVGPDGLHVHLSLSDAKGTTYGGHLVPGCLVFTTVELVVLDLSHHLSFSRELDPHTGYLELVIKEHVGEGD